MARGAQSQIVTWTSLLMKLAMGRAHGSPFQAEEIAGLKHEVNE